MKQRFLTGIASFLFFLICSTTHATTLTIIDTPTLNGTELDKGTRPSPPAPSYQASYQAYDATNNLAYNVGTVVVSNTIADAGDIHNQLFLNDGYYGNGSSWIDSLIEVPNTKSWVKIDLGSSYSLSDVMFGRDRLGHFDDRDPGQFIIQVAAMDAVFSNGDISGDDTEYTTIFNSSTATPVFSGLIDGNDTIQAGFDAIDARFLKITFDLNNAAIDEIEIHGSPSVVPEPTTMVLFGFGLLCLAATRRREV